MKWAFGYSGATGGGGPPAIIGDRIFVAGGDAQIYSLDAALGVCVLVVSSNGAGSHRHYSK